MPLGHRPASPEIIAEMYEGQPNPSIKGWLSIHHKGPKESPTYTSLWAFADAADAIIDNILANMTDANDGAEFARKVAQSKPLEINLRHLAADRCFAISHDARAADKIRLSKPPGGDPTPSWLKDDARAYSLALYKEEQRNRGTHPTARGRGTKGDGKIADPAKAKDTAARGRGHGRGRG